MFCSSSSTIHGNGLPLQMHLAWRSHTNAFLMLQELSYSDDGLEAGARSGLWKHHCAQGATNAATCRLVLCRAQVGA